MISVDARLYIGVAHKSHVTFGVRLTFDQSRFTATDDIAS
jgi:hypothetical protein